MGSARAGLLLLHLLVYAAVPLQGQTSSARAKPARPAVTDTTHTAAQTQAVDSPTKPVSALSQRATPVKVTTNVEEPRSTTVWLVYVVASILIAMTGLMIVGFFRTMEEGGSLAVESNWGGFGGGGGGWRLSRPLTYLIGLMFSAGLLTAIAIQGDLNGSAKKMPSTTSSAPSNASAPSADGSTTASARTAEAAEDSK